MTARELIDATARASGWPDLATFARTNSHDCALPFETAHFLDGFGHADGRFRFAPDWMRFGPEGAALPRLPDQWDVIDAATPDRPFRLVTAPARGFLNSSFTETPGSQAREKRPTVLIHPADAADLGLAEGALARLGNERGSVVLHVRPFDGVARGVVVVETLWPNAAYAEGTGINALTGADPVRPAGGAAFHDTSIWIRPA
jgi:anaerobic selenocysteine-containing dehydrogenase